MSGFAWQRKGTLRGNVPTPAGSGENVRGRSGNWLQLAAITRRELDIAENIMAQTIVAPRDISARPSFRRETEHSEPRVSSAPQKSEWKGVVQRERPPARPEVESGLHNPIRGLLVPAQRRKTNESHDLAGPWSNRSNWRTDYEFF